MGVSCMNFALLLATGLLVVLISVHAKSPRPNGGHSTSADLMAVKEGDDNGGHQVSRESHDVEAEREREREHYHHRRQFDAYLGTIRRLRRPYRSKYTIEQLMRLHVTPKVSGDIDMDPCKAGEYGCTLIHETWAWIRERAGVTEMASHLLWLGVDSTPL